MGKRVFSKGITIAIIIFTMLFSNFAPIISWAIEKMSNEEVVGEKIKFELAWGDNLIKDCVAGEDYKLMFKLTLSGVQTGFKNMKITVEDTSQPRAKIDAYNGNNSFVDVASSSSSTIVFNKNLDAGIETVGGIDISFEKAQDFQVYQKEINVILTGEYIDSTTGEAINVYITKTIKANVSTPDFTDTFSSKIQLGSNGGESITTDRVTEAGMFPGEYTVSNVYVNAPFVVEGHNVSYGEYKLKLKRISSELSNSEVNSEENFIVSISNLPSYMNQRVVRNNDGSAEIIVTVGEQKENYTEEDMFDFRANIRVNATFKIPEDTGRNGTTSSTKISFDYSGNVKGFDIKKGKDGTTFTERTDSFSSVFSRFVGLNHFIGDYMAETDISSSSTNIEDFNSKLESGTVDIKFESNAIYWDRRPEDQKQKLRVDSYKGENNAYIEYYTDEGVETKTLNNQELTLKEIVVSSLGVNVAYAEFYKKGETEPFFTADSRNNKYTVPEGEVITDYYVLFDYMYGTNANAYPRWTATYTLHKDKLAEILSETELQKVRAITRYQYGYFGETDVSKAYEASYTITYPSVAIKHSYFDVELNGMNDNFSYYGRYSSAQIKLVLQKNKNTNSWYNDLQNSNPKFFVKLPEHFDYDDMRVSLSSNNSSTIQISNKNCPDEGSWYLTSDGYLVINCVGDWYNTCGAQTIEISFKKKLNTYQVPSNNTIQAYMITSNGYYLNTMVPNVNNFSMGDEVPSYIARNEAAYKITVDNSVTIRNGIISGTKEHFPSASNTTVIGSKDNPVLSDAGSTVTYKTVLSSNGNRISNINVISRLPIANNTSISGTVRDLESSIGLSNLKNIQVKECNGARKTEQNIPADKYKILYSTDINANFDSTFTEYVEGDTNISTAKTIQVLFNEDYYITSETSIFIYFDMEMPNAEGVSAQISAVRYKSKNSEDITELEPAAVYVQKGSNKGKFILQKRFVGSTLESTSLANIEFKIKNIKTGEFLVISGQTDENGIIKTDSTGKFTLTDIPEGKYEVIEVTEFQTYGPEGYVSFEIENGNTVEKTFKNIPKIASLVIKKEWNNYPGPKNKQQGIVTFLITRYGDYSMSYSTTASTDLETGQVTVNIPYGRYTIKEISIKNGWYLNGSSTFEKNITFNTDGMEVTMTNYLKRGTLTIVKTVPNEAGVNDTVDGISFRVKGMPYAESYIDYNGVKQSLEYDETIVVGEDKSGVSQDISSDRKKVTIVISGLLLGNYTITEVDMPKVEIDGQQENKYADLVTTVTLNDTSATLNIQNVWKKGTIRVKKTADEGVELDQFKFRVHGTSKYGTTVDQIINVDEYGNGYTSVYIGDYTIEEVGTNAFNSTYEVIVDGESIKSENSANIKVEYNKVTNVNIENKMAYGYVKVIKTLEDSTDLSKVQGIKFEINGVAPTGENIHREITIGEDGTGISTPIPAGGDYEISEVPSTVPKDYEVMMPTKIEISRDNTIDKPYEFEVVNKRGKGNLEIITETNPENGETYPITYSVQEINVNESNGSYERIEGTQKIVDGDMLGKASLLEIPAGSYIVEQTVVPTGWIKDTPKIVDVPVDDYAKAIFLIEKPEDFEDSKVIISKSVYNPGGEIASDADYLKYKLNKDETFEVRLVNTLNGKEYYTFMSTTQNGVIAGLPQGTYELHEVYKPKYNVKSYGIVNGESVEPIEAVDGKYYIEIGDAAEGKNEVKVHIDNIIDKSFGFGGQDSKENLSKVKVENIPEVVTRATLLIVDEEGNKIEGCAFEIYNKNNKKIAEFSPKNKQVIIKGLEVGTYTIKNTRVPNGYLPVEDCTITVYSDVVRIKRIEVQKNIPRGTLTISTKYSDGNITKFVPKSKYKIVNSNTGEVVTFQKMIDGSYKKSNLADATDTISIRAGEAKIVGIETGKYEVGITNITGGFVLERDDVEEANIVKDQTTEIVVNASRMGMLDVEAGYEANYILDYRGNLYGWGRSYRNIGAGNSDLYEPTLVARDVKKFSTGYDSRIILYNDGSVATFGSGSYGQLGLGDSKTSADRPQRFGVRGKKIIDVSTGYYSTLMLDEDGKVWYAGWNYSIGLGYELNNTVSGGRYIYSPICLSDIEGSPFKNITVKKVFAGLNMNAVIDTEGRLWTWDSGNANYVGYIPTENNEAYKATCVSLKPGNSIYEAYKKGIRIVDVGSCFALDEEGNIYFFNTNYGFGQSAWSFTSKGSTFAGKKFIKAVCNECSSSNNDYKFCLIDEDGKLYINFVCVNDATTNGKYKNTKFTNIAMGYESIIAVDINNKLYGQAKYGNYDGSSSSTIDVYSMYSSIKLKEYQMSLQEYSSYFIHDIKFKKVETMSYGTIALDYEGNIWTWGNTDSYNVTGQGYIGGAKPKLLEFNEDVKFRDIATDGIGSHMMFAVDTKGRVWLWGYSSYHLSGTAGRGNSQALTKMCLSEIEYEATDLNTAYKNGITIEEIMVDYNIVIARDNRNKLWAWGSNSGTLGNNISKATCISDQGKIKELYDAGLTIEKYSYFCNYLAAVDNNGALWFVNSSEKIPITQFKESDTAVLSKEVDKNGLKIVDVKGWYDQTLVVLDELGRIWTIKGSDFAIQECISTKEESNLLQEYSNGNKIKWISKTHTYSTPCLGIDSNGHIWDCTNDKCIANNTEYIYVTWNSNSYLAIDKNGHIWVWGYASSILGISNAAEPMLTTSGNANNIYNMNITDFVGTRYGYYSVEAEDGYVYNISSGYIEKGSQTVRYLTNQGIKIKDYNASCAIDNDGKLYLLKNGEWTCETDTEGTELYEAYRNDNSRLEEIINSYYRDSNNKLWFSNGKSAGDFVFKKFVNDNIIEDINGDYWIYGDNTYGILGTGNYNSQEKFVKINLGEGIKPKKLVYYDGKVIYLIDNRDIVWAWGYNTLCEVGKSNSESCVLTPYCWNLEVTDLYIFKHDYSNGVAHAAFAIDKSGCVWTAGVGNDGTSRGLQGKSYRTLGRVDNYQLMGKVKKLIISSDSCYAINEDKQLWVWGCNAFGSLGYETTIKYMDIIYLSTRKLYAFAPVDSPVCVTNTLGELYHKEIKDVIDINKQGDKLRCRKCISYNRR